MKGQALITLIFFSIIAMTITTAAIILIAVNSASGTKFQQSTMAYEIAQSGAENAELRIIRDPSYTGETLAVGEGTATITRTGSGTVGDPYIITSKGQIRNYIRTIQVTGTMVSDQFSVVSQKEIF